MYLRYHLSKKKYLRIIYNNIKLFLQQVKKKLFLQIKLKEI
jgi:hypothetical protein